MNVIVERDYETYRRWFERSLDLIWRLPPQLRLKADPMAEVAKAEKISKSKAVRSLYAGIKDTVAMTDRYSAIDVQTLDANFKSESLPSLTSVRAMVVSKLDKIIKRGVILSEDEFYGLKSLEDCDISDETKAEVQRLLGAYEVKRLG
ncbi:MAG: hypothetical protein E6Q67_07575 [Roseateles sp.]|nr:MAG: hypothetical protein E6Q67_07575 [Roseateles sp.]